MKSIPDEDYNAYFATLEELKEKKYKSRVHEENRNHDYAKFAINRSECNTVIKQNIDKAWMISETNLLIDGMERLLPDLTVLLSAQLARIESQGSIWVLCTCAFYIPDYNPELIS